MIVSARNDAKQRSMELEQTREFIIRIQVPQK
jgi:hypothetical protein